MRVEQLSALAAVVATSDLVTANYLITRSHFELSGLLDAALGPHSGANFHTWAVWGSREAGRTIARGDVIGLTPMMAAVGALLGALFGWWAGFPSWLVAVTAAALCAGATRALLERARRHIAHGNRLVLAEIGSATIEFLTAVTRQQGGDHLALEHFLATLEPGPADDGGQDLLRRAFTCYAAAIAEALPERRHQLVFAANCFAVRHEHTRLQLDIRRSMPWALRRLLTRHRLDFWVGAEHLHVGHDLGDSNGDAYPSSLATLTVSEARAAVRELRNVRRPPGTLTGSAAADWTVLDQRMNYIVDLFRSRHLAPEVFDAPYGDHADRLLPR